MKYVTVVRGQLKSASQQEAQAIHDAILEQLPAVGRPLGAIGHQPYLNPQNPKEFLAIDTWTNLQGLQKFMNDPKVAEAFGNLFEGMPDVTIWGESGWSSFYDG
jgi:quinol monooxygenase YgiN